MVPIQNRILYTTMNFLLCVESNKTKLRHYLNIEILNTRETVVDPLIYVLLKS